MLIESVYSKAEALEREAVAAIKYAERWMKTADQEFWTEKAEAYSARINEVNRRLGNDRGDDISWLIDDGPSLGERAQRIIKHPEHEAGEQDERVLEALAERCEELGLAEPVRQQDDQYEVIYSAYEPEQT